jgi:hypothetical protein
MIIFSDIGRYYWEKIKARLSDLLKIIGVYAYVWISCQHGNIFCYDHTKVWLKEHFKSSVISSDDNLI